MKRSVTSRTPSPDRPDDEELDPPEQAVAPDFLELGRREIDAILLTALSYVAANKAAGFPDAASPVAVGLLRAAATVAIMSKLPRDRFEGYAGQAYDVVRAENAPQGAAPRPSADDMSMFDLEA